MTTDSYFNAEKATDKGFEHWNAMLALRVATANMTKQAAFLRLQVGAPRGCEINGAVLVQAQHKAATSTLSAKILAAYQAACADVQTALTDLAEIDPTFDLTSVLHLTGDTPR